MRERVPTHSHDQRVVLQTHHCLLLLPMLLSLPTLGMSTQHTSMFAGMWYDIRYVIDECVNHGSDTVPRPMLTATRTN